MKIEVAITGVVNSMRESGFAEYTIQQANWNCFSKIHHAHIKNGETDVSRELLTSMCRDYHEKYERGEIRRRRYRDFVNCSHRLISFNETGVVDFSRVVDRRKFIPTYDHLKLIESIKAGADTTERQKIYIDTILRSFFCFIEAKQKSLDKITVSDYIDFINLESKSNCKGMRLVIVSLQLANNYFFEKGISDLKIDLSSFSVKQAPRQLITPYTQEEINSIINVIPKESKTYRRDTAIILLAFNTGLRGIDILHLKLVDINWNRYEISLVQHKTGKSIIVPVNGKTLNAIADYILYERPKNGEKYIFLTSVPPYKTFKNTSPLGGMIDKYCRRAGIEKKPNRSFHSIRRAFGTELAIAEVPITSISQMLGHADMSADKAYLSFNKSQTSLCAADFSEVPILKGFYNSLKLKDSPNDMKEKVNEHEI